MMRSVKAAPAVAMLVASALPALAFDRGPPAQVSRPVRAPAINLTGSDSTGVISGMSAKRPGGVSRLLSDILDNSLDVRDFGARDDDETPDTDAFNAAVAAASAKGRTLRITASAGGAGRYRIGAVDWKNANLEMDEGVQLLNLDGTRYQGGFASSGVGLIGITNPGFDRRGQRISTPHGRSMAFTKPGNRDGNYTTWSGISAKPYDVFSALRDFALIGQTEATSGSFASSGRFANVYNASNGPGTNITCTATNGSAVLTNCTPAPTATHAFTYKDGTVAQVQNVYAPSRIIGPGIPVGASARAFNATSITLGAPGSYTATTPYTGTTGTITINAQSGRSEFNIASWHLDSIGTTEAGGPAGGMNWYNDIFVQTNSSPNPANQEGALAGLEVFGIKQVPGLLRDDLHNGSYGLVVPLFPVAGKQTYTAHAGIAVTGWAGPAGTLGAQVPGTSAAAEVGVQVGGGCASVYCSVDWQSWFKTGLDIRGYETGIVITQPHNPSTGTAIFTDTGAGNVDIRDNLIVGTSIIETGGGTPASATAPCTRGQRTWDMSYEYRCVAANTWKRAALSTW